MAKHPEAAVAEAASGDSCEPRHSASQTQTPAIPTGKLTRYPRCALLDSDDGMGLGYDILGPARPSASK